MMTTRIDAVQPTARRVLIIHTDGNTFNNPTLKCLLDIYLSAGAHVDLRYPRSRAPEPAVKGLHRMPFGRSLIALKRWLFDRLCSWHLAKLVTLAEYRLLYRKRRHQLIVGVDRQGLIEAAMLHDLTGIPYAYISFEIMFAAETSVRFKALERRGGQKASLWVVQDTERAGLLAAENQLPADRLLLLPLASARPGQPTTSRLRDSLKIPREMHVAIIIGSLWSWTQIDEVLRSLPQWPPNWALIVHDRYGQTRKIIDAESHASLVAGGRLYLSESAPDSVDDLGEVLTGIDVGLAFYRADYAGPYTGRNLAHLGLASGKISTYLRHGVPVLINEIGLYASAARNHGFGMVIESPRDIGEKIDQLLDKSFSDAARRYFAEHLDFVVHQDRLIGALNAVSGGLSPVTDACT